MTSSAIGEFTIGQSPIQGPAPPPAYSPLLRVIPSYLYQQYADDSDLQAFVDAYNEYAQTFLDWFNGIHLPIYTRLSGDLLDWVAEGLYGLTRPAFASTFVPAEGAFNTLMYDAVLTFNGFVSGINTNYVLTSDDVFKRCITWNFFKGDGDQFKIKWLKKRVVRFLTGVGGSPVDVDQTYGVSVQFGADNLIIISVSSEYDYNLFLAMKEGIETGVLQLPFQFQYQVFYSDNPGTGFGYFAFGVSSF